MSLDKIIESRKSIRKFTEDEVPQEVLEKAFRHAILAPNSSNMQTWDFYHVQTPEKKQNLVKACFSQSAARTAKELVVITANLSHWKRANPRLIEFAKSVNAPKPVMDYYQNLMPMIYRYGFCNSIAFFRWISTWFIGFFKPVSRYPIFKRDLQEVGIKSAALAAQNFVLSLTEQGYATCMMEGFDKKNVMKILKLKSPARIVMVIAIGKEGPRGTWGPRFRIPFEEVVHRV